jgi:hypothetical protein
MMSVEMKVKVKPFDVPNFVIQEVTTPGLKQDGFREAPKYSVKELDSELLSALCDRFREDVFSKAGKIDPRLK